MTAQAMMRVKYKRPRSWDSAGASVVEDLKKEVGRRLVVGLTDMQNSILETPVYTGKTLGNYRWSIGEAIESTRAAIADPPLPGKTSDTPIGREPRRRANAERLGIEFQEMLAEVRSNPFQDIFLTNNVPNFSDVEYGTYSKKTSARTPPGGMTRRGETLLEYNMMGYLKRVA